MGTTFPGYRFHAGEASVLVEIYLPKKARFQGALYDALTAGFNPGKVRRHLADNEARIRGLMRDYYSVEYSAELVDSMGRMMGGYSLYEVDGVFYAEEREQPVIEERTQVIRIMFLPPDIDVGVEGKVKKQVIREYLRFTGDREDFEAQVGDRLNLSGNAQFHSLAAALRRWECQVALFVFGYIVDSLCEKIRILKDESGIEEEDEIWVTSFWNLVINRVVKAAT